MRTLTNLSIFFFTFQLFSQALYNYDEIWSGKDAAISATDNGLKLDVYTEIYNDDISAFKRPFWQYFTHNTLLVQENNHESFSNWGGVDPNMYRDLVGYTGRERSGGSDPNMNTTVNVNSSMDVPEIESVINAAESGTTILFQAGTYDFDQPLSIHKNNLTLKGVVNGNGEPQVIIDMYDIADVTGRQPTAFDIRKSSVTSSFGNNGGAAAAIFIGRSTTALNAEDRLVTLDNTNISQIDAGDFIVFSYEGDPFFNERNSSSNERLRSVVEIESVDYETRQVTLKSGVGMDFDPSRPVSTNRILVIEKEDVISNVVIKNFIFQSFNDADYNAQVDPHDFTYSVNNLDGGNAVIDGNSAISIRSGHEIDIVNVTIRNAMSNGISINGGYEIYIDDYLFDGAMNNGAGGNGYGIFFGDTHYSTVTNFRTGTDKPVRHAFIFAFNSTGGYNQVNMTYSNSNGDFHGAADFGNIIYFDDIDVREMDSTNPPIFDYRYEWQPRNFGDYTPPPLNQMQNIVLMKTADAPREGNIEGYDGFDNPNDDRDNQGSRNNGNASANSQTVYAANTGSNISTWGIDDILVSGAGDDILDGGSGQDFFVFFSNSKNDIIKSFVNSNNVKNALANSRNETGFSFRTKSGDGGDRIVIKENVNESGIRTAADALARVSQQGDDVLIDLGNENKVIIEDFIASNLVEKDFEILLLAEIPPLSVLAPQKEALVAYPIPSGEYIILKSSSQKIGKTVVIDNQGKSVLNVDIEAVTGQIDISSLNPGIYFIRTEKGDSLKFTK